MPESGAFHVVSKRHHGQRWGYEVYCNNVPYLKGSSQPLGRREARWIASKLNAETKLKFVPADQAAGAAA